MSIVKVRQGSVINEYKLKDGVDPSTFARKIGGRVVTSEEEKAHIANEAFNKQADDAAIAEFQAKRIAHESSKINKMVELEIIDSDGVDIELLKLPAKIRSEVAGKVVNG